MTGPLRSARVRTLTAVLLGTLGAQTLHAQCGPVVNTFPHHEGFENGPAWTSGGMASDWAWGIPGKNVIDVAGEGQRCWMIGGLTSSFYSYGQQSWVASPCFDLSSVAHPWVSFQLFWECERQYDGLAFQYSLDQGATWTNVGAAGGPAHCLNTNWYNTTYVNHLTLADPRQGWTGRIGPTQGSCAGGQGSNGWVTASHCLDHLAGEPSVKFRFVFGAGTTCNSYDGVAFDDFFLGEAPPNAADFIFACGDNAVDFLSTSALCPTTLSWDFGDPASGAFDHATGLSPSHTFSAPGVYTVSLTAQGPCNASSTITRTVEVPGVTILAAQPGCAGNNGMLTAQVDHVTGPVQFLWSPGGQTTAQISGLGPGTYTVQVSGPGICTVEATAVLLPASDALQITLDVTPESCAGLNDGAIHAQVTGGTGPITHAWDPPLASGPIMNDLAPGLYTLTATDAQGCTATATANVTGPAPILLTAPPDAVLCAGEELLLVPQVIGGTPPLSLTFAPAGPLVLPTQSTVYTITATDAQGCAAAPVQVTVDVVEPVPPSITAHPPAGCAPHCPTLQASALAGGTFLWDLGDGTTATGAITSTCYPDPGLYQPVLTHTDANGCTTVTTLPSPIIVRPTPMAVFVADPPVTTIGSPTVTFTATTSDGATHTWEFGEEGTAEGTPVVHTFLSAGCHPVRLAVMNDVGCAHETEGRYCVEEDFALYVPNAFTPDGDGLNDVFTVLSTVRAPAHFQLVVMDRWGRSLFRTTDPLQGWDGTAGEPLPTGVYVWQVAITDVAGHLHEATGHITLLR
jgi:gliding motility-associated-like protein